MTRSALDLVRPELRDVAGYRTAEPRFDAVRLHANELPWTLPARFETPELNRYPAPRPADLAAALARAYGVAAESVLPTRGSDDAIDLLVRAFCGAGEDAVIVCPPTFGMYALAATLQGARLIEVPLDPARGFALDVEAVLAADTPEVKLIFLCSPNNPTGNAVPEEDVMRLVERLDGCALVVVDEAYIEFSAREGLARRVAECAHLAVVRSLSKAHGLAGARCGALVAEPALIELLGRLAPPYALSSLTIEAALARLTPQALAQTRRSIESLRTLREALAARLAELPIVRAVWPSETNFLLIDIEAAAAVAAACGEQGVLVRAFAGVPALDGKVRITVGTEEQNQQLVECLEALDARS